MMERAIIVPTAKKPEAVPSHMAPSRSTAIGMNGSAAVIIRQAKHAHSTAEARNSPKISGAPQPYRRPPQKRKKKKKKGMSARTTNHQTQKTDHRHYR